MSPKIAIVDADTLAAIGLRQLLQEVMPVVTIDTFGSFAELEANSPDTYVHYFVTADIVLAHRPYFADRQRKTIVLTLSHAATNGGFRTLSINQPESHLVRQLLQLQQHGHADGRNIPPILHSRQQKTLTDREIEVMALIVQGHINKEIADRLNIGLSTVITHRRNIMEKLGLKSVSALTIYAVIHGYVDIHQI